MATQKKHYDNGSTVTLLGETPDGNWRVIDQYGIGVWDVVHCVEMGLLTLFIGPSKRGRPPKALSREKGPSHRRGKGAKKGV